MALKAVLDSLAEPGITQDDVRELERPVSLLLGGARDHHGHRGLAAERGPRKIRGGKCNHKDCERTREEAVTTGRHGQKLLACAPLNCS